MAALRLIAEYIKQTPALLAELLSYTAGGGGATITDADGAIITDADGQIVTDT